MNEAEQLLLWRWSTLVQLSSLAMIAAFFVLLARTNPRGELKWWARAWSFNVLAILFTSMFWMMQSDTILPLITLMYTGGKAAFTLLLMQGVWTMIRPGARLFTTRGVVIAITTYAIAATVLLRDVTAIGIVQHSLMGSALLVFALVLARTGADGLTWLIAGIALRGVLGIAEAGAYMLQMSHPVSGTFAPWVPFAGSFVSASSSFDTGSEWLLVLGSVLAVSDRGRRALEASHHRLVLAQDDLRRLADRDPLTGAINRRALGDIFRDVHAGGALLLFFDLDGFKKINDEHGHAIGDACLKLFATALRESFRPDDHVVRYGGDEFLVIARGLDQTAARSRVEDLTGRLHQYRSQEVWCGFSVGMSELAAGADPSAALQLADQNMYKAKHRDRRQ
jgi:diguanylate cyclase (GGDEF)-like protein